MKPTKVTIAVITLFATLVLSAVISARHGPLIGAIAGFVIFAGLSAVMAPREAAVFVNNFGVLNNTMLLNDVFSLFLNALLPLKNLIIDVQDPKTGAREAKPGDTITIKDWRQVFTAYTVGAGGYNAPTTIDISAGDNVVTLPNAVTATSVALTAAEYRVISSGATGGADYMAFRDRLQACMMTAIGKKLITDWFATITAATYTSSPTVSAAGTFTRSTEIDLDLALFNRDVPRTGAQVILSPAAYAEWAKDHIAINTNTAANIAGNLISGGVQSDVSDFTFFRTSLTMPTDSARGFATTQTASLGAFRIPDEPNLGDRDPVSLAVVIEPRTKIPFLIRLWKNATTGGIQMDVAIIYTFKAGQIEALQRITAS